MIAFRWYKSLRNNFFVDEQARLLPESHVLLTRGCCQLAIMRAAMQSIGDPQCRCCAEGGGQGCATSSDAHVSVDVFIYGGSPLCCRRIHPGVEAPLRGWHIRGTVRKLMSNIGPLRCSCRSPNSGVHPGIEAYLRAWHVGDMVRKLLSDSDPVR